MIRRLAGLLLAITFALPAVAQADLPPQTQIINNLPQLVDIRKFGFRVTYRDYSDRLLMDVEFANKGSQDIEAYKFGFAYFDYFNERTLTFGGYGLDKVKAGASKRSSWEQSRGTNALTGFVWVDSLRLADGTVVRANTDEIAQVISDAIKEPVTAEALVENDK